MTAVSAAATNTPEKDVLLSEDFESGVSKWRLEEGWKAVASEDGKVLEGTGHSWARCDSCTGYNYLLSLRLKIIKGTIHLNLRYGSQTGNRYFIGISSNNIYLNKQNGQQFIDLATASCNISREWHDVEIKAFEGLINVYIDKELYIVYQDENPLPAGCIAFETLDESDCMIDDIVVSDISENGLESQPPSFQFSPSESVTPDTVHEGDLKLNGSKTMEIEDTAYLQRGNVYINDHAKLVIKNSTFILGRGDTPTIHTYFFVEPNASLQIENCTVITDNSEKMGALIIIRNEGKVDITESKTQIHLIEMYGNAILNITGSTIVNPIGGLIQVAGGKTRIIDSTIGALGLTIPKGAKFNISGLKSGVYYDSWDVRDMIPNAGYGLSLEKTTILKDNLEYGPYERGWLFFPDPDSSVSISNSELRKVFIDLKNDSASFSNLKMGAPSSLRYRNIRLNDVVMRGEWPFTIIDSEITISDSEYLFLQPSGNSTINLINSNVVEFIPRSFRGTVNFDNCTWTNAGEIIGGEDYHSDSNDFTIKGSLKIGSDLKEHLQWKDATVTREYEVTVSDNKNTPLSGLTLIINGKSYKTDENGKAVLSIRFDQSNYSIPHKLQVFKNESLLIEYDIDFFTETPVRITAQG